MAFAGRRDLFPPETFPSVWERVEEMIRTGSIRAVDEVERELAKRADGVHEWAKQQTDLFVDLDAPLQRETAAVLAAHPRLVGRGHGRNDASRLTPGVQPTLAPQVAFCSGHPSNGSRLIGAATPRRRPLCSRSAASGFRTLSIRVICR